jgi:multidrug resistance efflux pump
MDSNETIAQLDQESVRARLATHEKALAALTAEQAQLAKQLETLRAERQVLEAVAKKVATRRSSVGK